MSEKEFGSILSELKQDLKTIKELSSSDKDAHLAKITKPLLHSTFLSLGRQATQLNDSYELQFYDYLMLYLTFTQPIAVEATMCLYRLAQIDTKFNSRLTEKIDNLIEIQDSRTDKYNIFKIVSHIFTFDPILGAEIFTKLPSFVALLTNETVLLTNQLDSINSETAKLLEITLVLLSNSCVDESSRSIIASMYINLLIKCISLPSNVKTRQVKCYAATITTKVWRMINPEKIANNANIINLKVVLDIILESLNAGLHTSIEGLSLLCTNFQLNEFTRTEKVVDKLIELLSHDEHSKYGILNTLSLMILPKRVLDIQQKSLMRLKDSNSISNIDIFTNEKLKSDDIKYNKEQVIFVLEKLISKEIVSKHLTFIFKSMEASKGMMNECIRLMYYILFPDMNVLNESILDSKSSLKKKFLIEAKQSIKLLTAYLIGTSQNFKYTQKSFIHLVRDDIEIPEADLESRSLSIKALSSPLISSHVGEIYDKQNEEAALSSVPFLLEVLVQHDLDVGTSIEEKYTPFKSLKKQIFSNFDVYYAIVSLAAICSLPFDRVKQSVFTLGFDSVMNLINTNDDKLQLAALQLLREMCMIPLCVARLFNWENEEHDYYQNFSILSHMLLASNTDSQFFALEIFVSVSAFGIVSEKLAKSELFCKNLKEILVEQSTEENLVYYALYILYNMCQVGNGLSNSHISLFKTPEVGLEKFVQSPNEQIRECSRAVLSYL